jgi:hypothetical protein
VRYRFVNPQLQQYLVMRALAEGSIDREQLDVAR